MDQNRSEAVNEAFISLFNAGLIYRANRFVNWCPKLESAVSDIEVESQQINKPVTKYVDNTPVEFGWLYEISYQLEGSDNEQLNVSTTRPETIFGDRAIAVSPHDERYKKYVGRFVKHPLIDDLLIPVICDNAVDRHFGTGVLKITPMHSIVDYEIAKRHNIDCVSIMDKSGNLINCSKEVNGMNRLKARSKIVRLLQQRNRLVEQVPHSLILSVCSRTGDVIEPVMVPQWYLSVDSLKKEVLKSSNKLKFVPSLARKEWDSWFKKMGDWCISRQIWWGHQIPVWKILEEDKWIAAPNYEKALQLSVGKSISQDSDVLDTWFSSALLPLSAFGWPKSKDIQPLPFIESGQDILFFWIARMALLCKYFSNELPFKEIILHPLVRDSEGRKMSKSLGNVIDPMDIINGVTLENMKKALLEGNLPISEVHKSSKQMEKAFPNGIPAQGIDIFRFGLFLCLHHEQRILLDMNSFSDAHRFVSKLWNLARYFNQYKGKEIPLKLTDSQRQRISLLKMATYSKLHYAVKGVKESFEQRKFFNAADIMKNFLLNDLSSVYVELTRFDVKDSKSSAYEVYRVFSDILHIFLKLIHPIVPCISGVMLHSKIIPERKNSEFLSFPTSQQECLLVHDNQAEVVVQNAYDVLIQLRKLESPLNKSPSREHTVYISTSLEPLKYFYVAIEQSTNLKLKSISQEDTIDLMRNQTFILSRISSDTILLVPKKLYPSKRKKLRKNLDDLQKKLDKIQHTTSSSGYEKAPSYIKLKNYELQKDILVKIQDIKQALLNTEI